MTARGLARILLAALAAPSAAQAVTLAVDAEVNASRLAGAQHSAAVAVDPVTPARLVVAATADGGGLSAARSTDGGASFVALDASDGTIADGDGGDPLPPAGSDPALAWDGFGNLFLVYRSAGAATIEVALSSDGGVTFAPLATFTGSSLGRPSIAVGPGGASGPASVWVVYVAGMAVSGRGAPVTGLGAVGAFTTVQNPPSSGGGNAADLAVGPSGQVAVVYQQPATGEAPTSLRVHLDANGLLGGGFGAGVLASATNVGGADLVPSQPANGIDASPGLAWDRSPGPQRGRLYLVYADEVPDESGDTDVLVRFSDNAGATWSAPVRVNDDPPGRGQLLPRVAVDQTSGALAVSWLDTRDDPAGIAVGLFAAVSLDGGATFTPSTRVSAGSYPPPAGVEHGVRTGLGLQGGRLFPAWADGSNSTADNPDGTAAPDVHVATVRIVAECTLHADCDDGDACNGAETCVAGGCVGGAPLADGASCSDGDACTLADACAAGVCVGGTPLDCAPCLVCDRVAGCGEALRTDCRGPVRSRRSSLVLAERDAGDRLVWEWGRGAATAITDFGSPSARTAFELCVYDERGGVPVLGLAAVVPPGGVCGRRPCWRRTRNGFRFRDRDSTPEGLELLELRAGGDGKARVVVRGGGPALRLPVLPLAQDPRVTVQLRSSDGVCWEAGYSTAARNDARRFKARSD